MIFGLILYSQLISEELPCTTIVNSVKNNSSQIYTASYGNTPGTVTQLKLIDSATSPVMLSPPTNFVIECLNDIPPMILQCWVDNCEGSSTVDGIDGPLTGNA